MPEVHTIEQGEQLSQIAEDHGFRSYKTIWEDAANADLAAKRDPHVLAVGDEVTVPDFQPKTISRQIDQSHKFIALVQPLFLKVRLLDLDGDPLTDTDCDVGVDAAAGSSKVASDDDGKVEQEIARKSKTGEIVAHPPLSGDGPDDADVLKYDLRIGHLNPKHKMSGQQARLNNMGYFAGFSLRDLDQFLWAVEEFECEIKKKQVKARPTLVAAPKDGEDVAGDDPDAETGVQEDDLRGLIQDTHGI